MRFSLIRLVLVLLAALSLIGYVSAQDSNWKFNEYDEPLNVYNISEDRSAIFLVDLEVKSSNSEIKPWDLESFSDNNPSDQNYVGFEYMDENQNGTDEIKFKSLSYSEEIGAWYANLTSYSTMMSNITFRANGNTLASSPHPDAEFEANRTIETNVTSLKPQLVDTDLDYGIESPLKAGRSFKADVKVMDETGKDIEASNVSLYFHKLDKNIEKFELENYNSDESYHYNSEIEIPGETNTTYVMRIIAKNSEKGVIKSGSQSFVINTAPAINGEIASINSTGCEDVNLPTECDQDIEINTNLDITESGAESANLTLYKYDLSTDKWVKHNSTKMSEVNVAQDGVLQRFESTLGIPDLDTSEYSDEIKIEYYAWNRDRDYRTNHRINLNSFAIEDRSNPSAFKSREHTIRLFLGQKYSRDSYNKSRFQNMEVNMTGPETFETTYSMSDFEYIENDGSFENTVVIPEDSANGAYNLDIGAENIYGEYKEISRGLQVRDVNSTFSADSELDLEYETPGLFTENITLENLVDSEKTLDIYNSHENISVQDEVTLGSGAQKDISFDVNLSTPGSFETEIEFADSEARYNETTDINVEGPQCEIYEGDLCINQSEINIDTNESSGITQDISITNFGDQNQIVNTSITGNATEAFNITEQINVSDSPVLEVEFNPDSQGSYEGDLEMEWEDRETSIGLNGVANFSEVNVGLETNPASIDMGVVPETQPFTTELDIENTGDTAVNNIAASSTSLDLQIDEFDLAAGESETVDISISPPQTGSISLSGESSEGEVRTDVPVDGDVIEDYSERTDEITERVDDLRNRTDNEDLESRLTDVSGMVTQVESDWDSGNYEESRSTFQDAQNELESIERELNSQQQDDNGGGDDQEESGGGLPILPIVLILVVLLGIGGFVFYESYIPEEGDPLYGVLGE